MTFRLFTDANCTQAAIVDGNDYSEVVTVVGGAAATTNGYTTDVAQTYYWTAHYSGDSANDARDSGCGVETTTITAVEDSSLVSAFAETARGAAPKLAIPLIFGGLLIGARRQRREED